ncbi:unnamed protein product [Hymenolepis diminuta]|uniref:MaoC-like domain-containing protein n=1 Tax=Hymenolepis diminuta TaxID=6216 RepID=A0A0R3SE76_HYMDI|nr:unnamed protein product [Hymenolepis diminuta]
MVWKSLADKTGNEFDNEGCCIKTWDPPSVIECTLTELEEDGTFLATARVRTVETHAWASLHMDELHLAPAPQPCRDRR